MTIEAIVESESSYINEDEQLTHKAIIQRNVGQELLHRTEYQAREKDHAE
jgi:hypothetical protein